MSHDTAEPAGEFDLIERCFRRPRPASAQTLLGIGDDAALIAPSPGHSLAIATDLLVEGTHFFPDTDPEALGWKTLAVNISDMAAMGAQPRWATLGAVLPAPTFAWVDAFCRGFFACADAFHVDLIGGDTTRGPRTFSVTIGGEVPVGQALRRDRAGLGDTVWVSGTPGRAALGLAHLQGKIQLQGPRKDDCLAALHRPQPRLALGLHLRHLASAAIDISDGLLADLGHLLKASTLGADLHIPDLPPPGLERDSYLAGGDDYELLFTAPPRHTPAILSLASQLQLPLTPLGSLVAPRQPSLILRDSKGHDITPTRHGYDHFA